MLLWLTLFLCGPWEGLDLVHLGAVWSQRACCWSVGHGCTRGQGGCVCRSENLLLGTRPHFVKRGCWGGGSVGAVFPVSSVFAGGKVLRWTGLPAELSLHGLGNPGGPPSLQRTLLVWHFDLGLLMQVPSSLFQAFLKTF